MAINKYLFWLVCCCLVFGWVSQAFGGIAVSPAKIDLVLEQNSRTVPVTFRNSGGGVNWVRVYAQGIKQKLEGGIEFIASQEGEFNGSRYVKISPAEFVINGDQSQVVSLVFEKPDNLVGSEIDSIIFFESAPTSEARLGGFAGVTSISRIGVIAEVVIPGDTVKAASVESVKVTQGQAGEPLEIITAVKNVGKVGFYPSGFVKIRNSLGELLAKVPIEPLKVLPGGERYLSATWKPDLLPKGEYQVASEVEGTTVNSNFTVLNPFELAQKNGEIVEFSVDAGSKNAPLKFKLLFHNAGNLALTPQAHITVAEAQAPDQVVAELDLIAQEISAGGNAELKGVLSEGLPSGNYTATAVVNYGGYSKAKASVPLEVVDKNIITKGSVTGFIIPSAKLGAAVLPKLSFHNSGNVPLSIEGLIEFKKGNGATVGQLPVNSFSVDSGKAETRQLSWDGQLPKGFYQADLTLSYGNNQVANARASFFVK